MPLPQTPSIGCAGLRPQAPSSASSTNTKAVPNGKSIRSRPFRAGGHTWHMLYYPNGNRAEKADFVAFYLCLDDAEACSEAVEAKAIFSLLDMEGNPVSS